MNILSWGCPKIPSVVSITGESTPRGRASANRPLSSFGLGKPLPNHVPTSWFHTTSPACSSLATRMYCNALPTLGFIPFPPSRLPTPRPCECVAFCLGGFPGMRSCPSKPSLRAQRPWRDAGLLLRATAVGSRHQPRSHPRYCTPTSFPARPCVAADDEKLPSRRWSSRGTSRSCSVPGPVADHLVAEVACSLLPWAWIHVPPARPEGSACESCFWYVKDRP